MKVCVDGGLRRDPSSNTGLAAIAYAVYTAKMGNDGKTSYTLVGADALPIGGVDSAFQIEATALEWSLEQLFRTMEGT